MTWIRIAAVEDCPPGKTLEAVAGDRIVALLNVSGEFQAFDGVCPHQGGPLGKGALSGSTLTCPWHGWQFDAKTGQHCLNPRICQERFAVRTEGTDVLVEIPDD